MYVQGVSTRKVKAITEELCSHAFSASTISAINKKLDGSLAAFAQRRLDEPFPYLNLDARSEKVPDRSEEHTSELQSLMRISYAVLCLQQKQQALLDVDP